MANLTKTGSENRPVGETQVCVFHRAFTGGKAGMNLEKLGKSYSLESREFYLMTLREFLELGRDYLPDLNRIRSTTDKKERAFLKKKLLPAGCISCNIKTRSSSVPKEEKIKAYNSLIVLDFDNLDDVEAAKLELSKWPCRQDSHRTQVLRQSLQDSGRAGYIHQDNDNQPAAYTRQRTA